MTDTSIYHVPFKRKVFEGLCDAPSIPIDFIQTVSASEAGVYAKSSKVISQQAWTRGIPDHLCFKKVVAGGNTIILLVAEFNRITNKHCFVILAFRSFKKGYLWVKDGTVYFSENDRSLESSFDILDRTSFDPLKLTGDSRVIESPISLEAEHIGQLASQIRHMLFREEKHDIVNWEDGLIPQFPLFKDTTVFSAPASEESFIKPPKISSGDGTW